MYRGSNYHVISIFSKKNKFVLVSYLSSACQSPSNRSRNRYRGGSGRTSFSSSTILLTNGCDFTKLGRKSRCPSLGGKLPVVFCFNYM